MKVKIAFDFSIHDEVRLVDIDMVGHVDALIQDVNGLQYRIVYWNDGTRKATWVYRREIEAVKKKSAE